MWTKKDYDEQKIVFNKQLEDKVIEQKQMFHEILCNEMYMVMCGISYF